MRSKPGQLPGNGWGGYFVSPSVSTYFSLFGAWDDGGSFFGLNLFAGGHSSSFQKSR